MRGSVQVLLVKMPPPLSEELERRIQLEAGTGLHHLTGCRAGAAEAVLRERVTPAGRPFDECRLLRVMRHKRDPERSPVHPVPPMPLPGEHNGRGRALLQ